MHRRNKTKCTQIKKKITIRNKKHVNNKITWPHWANLREPPRDNRRHALGQLRRGTVIHFHLLRNAAVRLLLARSLHRQFTRRLSRRLCHMLSYTGYILEDIGRISICVCICSHSRVCECVRIDWRESA